MFSRLMAFLRQYSLADLFSVMDAIVKFSSNMPVESFITLSDGTRLKVTATTRSLLIERLVP